MASVLPPDVSVQVFQNAMVAFAGVVGKRWVLASAIDAHPRVSPTKFAPVATSAKSPGHFLTRTPHGRRLSLVYYAACHRPVPEV